MILLLGASGYIGSAFAEALAQRGLRFTPLSRASVDYTRFTVLVDFLRECKPSFLINAAGFTGRPNVDACEAAQTETLAGNVLLPVTIAHACEATHTPWGHVSSGCIYNGAKVFRNSQWEIETDLASPKFLALRREHPENILGFNEADTPNFCFGHPPCSFYSGSKALAEEALGKVGGCYIWRVRMPFDGRDNPRNLLTKLQRYPRVYNNTNSISHRSDFVQACLDLWDRRAPFGIYNMTNPGHVTSSEVVELLRTGLDLERSFEFWSSDEEFYRLGAQTPRSNCIMETDKLAGTGVCMRPVGDALADAVSQWRKIAILRAA
jgi:dTDP-4-dehydrorhamnose reductase